MSRRRGRGRGRPARPYRIRVRTIRREPIDAEALARAALEHAAMNQRDQANPPPPEKTKERREDQERTKEPQDDRLA